MDRTLKALPLRFWSGPDPPLRRGTLRKALRGWIRYNGALQRIVRGWSRYRGALRGWSRYRGA